MTASMTLTNPNTVLTVDGVEPDTGGDVDLTAGDIPADPAGAAAAAQAAAIASAATYTDTKSAAAQSAAISAAATYTDTKSAAAQSAAITAAGTYTDTQVATRLPLTGGAISGSLTIGTALGVASGGTGLNTVAAGSYLKGNGTSALVPRTVSEVQSDLGTSSTGAWIGVGANVVLGSNMTADVSSPGYYAVSFRASRDGMLQGSGRINTAVNYAADATICTLSGALVPEKKITIPFRSGGGGAVAGFIEIQGTGDANPGKVSFTSAITVGAGAWFQLDCINARRTVAGS